MAHRWIPLLLALIQTLVGFLGYVPTHNLLAPANALAHLGYGRLLWISSDHDVKELLIYPVR